MHKSIFEAVTIPQDQFTTQANKILGDMADLLKRKNADYGGASMDMGMTGIAVHLHDKERRLVSLLERESRGGAPNFEGINDTLKDMIGYATIGLIIRNFVANVKSSESDLPIKATYLTEGLDILQDALKFFLVKYAQDSDMFQSVFKQTMRGALFECREAIPAEEYEEFIKIFGIVE